MKYVWNTITAILLIPVVLFFVFCLVPSLFISCFILPERWYLADAPKKGENKYFAWRAKLYRAFVDFDEVREPKV